MKPFSIPVVALGPGSHSEDEALNYLSMPSDMQTYRPPVLPEPETIRANGAAGAALRRIMAALDRRAESDDAEPIRLEALDPAALKLVNQVLGEGEVSARVELGDEVLLIQESVFAGVWRLRHLDAEGRTCSDHIEVAAIPTAARRHAGGTPPKPAPIDATGLASAPALLTEIVDRAPRDGQHVINLTLLPFTPEDGAYLDLTLGRGPVSILSRGYGNCRITATGMERVWWVQYFNSQDALILNTIEIADVPEVALAADEDIADSRERLAEVVAWLG